jgi:hypothetical protein
MSPHDSILTAPFYSDLGLAEIGNAAGIVGLGGLLAD